MKSNINKAVLFISAICISTCIFAQTPGSSPGSPAGPGSQNVNPSQSNPGGPGYNGPTFDLSRPATGPSGTSGYTGSGSMGYTGHSGYTGPTGTTGYLGTTGPSGKKTK